MGELERVHELHIMTLCQQCIVMCVAIVIDNVPAACAGTYTVHPRTLHPCAVHPCRCTYMQCTCMCKC